MTDFSAAATAIVDACERTQLRYRSDRVLAATAIRTAVEQVLPIDERTPWGSILQLSKAELQARFRLLAIADELDP